MITEPFELHRPANLDEALAIKAETGDDSAWYAGGTELLLAMKMGVMAPDHLIDIKRLSGFTGVEVNDGTIVVNGAATHADIIRATAGRPEWESLNALFRGVGNSRVRASGTLAGNLAFAEPRSDPACYLAAVGATVTLASSGGATRSIPMDEFIVGPYTTQLEDTELIVKVEIPRPSEIVYSRFKTLERPTVGVAVARGPELDTARVVVGAGTYAPTVCQRATAALASGESPRQIGELAAEEVEFMEDVTGSADYKAHLVTVLLERAIRQLSEEVGA